MATVKQIPTSEMAAQLNMKPQSIRKQYSQNGSYFGVIPQKLPNGKLLWPGDFLEILMRHNE